MPQASSSDFDMLTILVVILLLVALGALPTWPHSRSWGYYPSGGLGLVVLVLVILLLFGSNLAVAAARCAPPTAPHEQP